MNYPKEYLDVLQIAKTKFNAELGERIILLEKNAGSVTAINPEPAKQDTNRLRKGVTIEY